MNKNLEMINYIYQNAQMGQDTLTKILEIAQGEEFINLIESQQNEYQTIFEECEQKITDLNCQPKGLGKITELSTYFIINMKTLTDKTPSHIASIIMQGSVMGIIDITKTLKKYKTADPSIIALGQWLLKIEEKNLNECKSFL